MAVTVQKYLSLIDARRDGWRQEVRDQIEGGSNHLIILPNAPNFLEELAQLLGLDAERLPLPVDKHRLCSLSPFIEEGDFDRLLNAQHEGNLLFLVEQLDLPMTRPPQVKPFLVYCAIFGIVSQHDSQSEAREACSEYLHAMSAMRRQRDAAVFRWRGDHWHNTETC